MDARGNIFELNDEQKQEMLTLGERYEASQSGIDSEGNVFELSDEQKDSLATIGSGVDVTQTALEIATSVARLEGYLKGRAESDKHKHERLVWDSSKHGTYRRSEHTQP